MTQFKNGIMEHDTPHFNQDLSIRRATVADVETLQAIGIQTFRETFESTNDAGNLELYLNNAFSIAKLSEELRNPLAEFYFAFSGDLIAGYLKINSGAAQTEPQAHDSIEIERIYVCAAYHGKKVGQALYDFALQLALDRKASFLWLGVWERNSRAIRFYEKNGFSAFDSHVFVVGEDAQTDILMKKTLKPTV